LIDLHLHTTASDGRCTPQELVDQSAEAALTVIAITDHDTTAGIAEAVAAAAPLGIRIINGIEITAIGNGRDLHVLGYFINPDHEPFQLFLTVQRSRRVARIEWIADRLTSLGMPVDVAPLVEQAKKSNGRSVGRPLVARLMVDAGHVVDTQEAFDKWLSAGRPAFVARDGPSAEEVIGVIHAAGGIASLAHPGKVAADSRIPALAESGLDALEAFHPDHDARLVNRYVDLARGMNLLVTGGSDFHGDPSHGLSPGSVTLPAAEWARLEARHA
jgi:predicted metal-dependent phosphoesterase TrpH